MKPRTRPRTSVSIGSNQLSKSWTAVSFWGCEGSGFVVTLVMAWSPVRRFNAGRFEVDHPGDYATFNSNQPCYGTLLRHQSFKPTSWCYDGCILNWPDRHPEAS